MTYATDIAKNRHRVGFYVSFEGIATRLSTHDPASVAGWTSSDTFAPAIVTDSFSSISETLNRDVGFVEQGSLSFNVRNTAAVLALLRQRGGTDDTISGEVANNTATFSLTDNALPTTGVAYIGRETVNITGDSGSDRTVTRGHLDSLAMPHAAGTKISTVPLFWYTRRATLTAVNLETGTEAAFWTGTLSASPSFSDGVWALELTGVINDYLNRPLHTGWQEVDAISATVTAAGNLQFGVFDYREFVSPGYIRVSNGNASAIYGGAGTFITLGDSSPDTVTIDPGSRRGHSGDLEGNLGGQTVSLEQVDLVNARPGWAALQVILSDTGNGDNGLNDLLAGRAANAGSNTEGKRRRMGAAIPAAWVDVATFNLMSATEKVVAWIDETTKLGDFLSSEVLSRSGGYLYATGAGVLTFKQYDPVSVRASVTSYNTTDVIASNVTTSDDETGAISRATIQCNWDPVVRQYGRSIEILFRDDVAIYGERGTSLKLKSKGVWIGTPPMDRYFVGESTDLITLEAGFDRQRARMTLAGRRMTIQLPWRHHLDLAVASRFSWTDTRPPDHEGATGVTDRVYEVTGRTLDLGEGSITAECDEVPRGWLLAASAEVTSWDVGTLTLTLSTTGAWGDIAEDANPGSDFAAQWSLRMFDATDAFETSEAETIESVTATTIVLAKAPTAFIPAIGDIVIVEAWVDTGNTNDVSADVEDLAFAANSAFLVNSAGRAGPRWG